MAGEGGLFVGSLYGTLELDAKPFHQTLSSATKKGEKDLLDGLNQLGRQAAFGFGLGFAGFKLEGIFKDTISEARDAVRETRLTEAVIRSTGGAANVTAGGVDELANSLSKVAGVDDEVVAGGERVLLTFLKVRNEVGKDNDIFNQATKAALDMTAALPGSSFESNIIAIGKALNEPATGALALSRNGSLARSDLHQLQQMMKDGVPLIEQQRFILQKLGEQYSGAAAAGASAGDKLHVSIKNLEEAVGTGLLPEVNALDKGVGFLADEFTALPGPVQGSVVTIAALTTGAVAASIAVSKLSHALEGTAIASAALKGEDALLNLFPVLGTTAAAAGVVGVGAAVAVIGTSLVHAEHDASARTQALTVDMIEAGNASEAAAAQFISARLGVDSIAKGLKTGGVSIEEATRAILKGGSTFKDLETRLFNNPLTHNQALALQALRDSYVKASDAVAHHRKTQKDDNDAMGDGAARASKLAAQMEKLAAAQEKEAEAASKQHVGGLLDVLQAEQAVTSSEGSLADAVSVTGDAVAASTSKMKTYADAVSEVFDSVLAADRAHMAASSAIKKLTDTNREFTGDAVARLQGMIRLDGKQVATQEDVHGALLDVIEAREREVDAMANSGEIANTAAARHQALVDSLLDLRTEYPDLTDDIDKYLDAARKIPELPLEAAIDRTTTKQRDFKGATLDVVTALFQQAGGEHATTSGLEAMNRELDLLITKYKDFPAVRDIFVQALNASIAQEAQLLHIAPELLAILLNPDTATAAVQGMFNYSPTHRAMGGGVAPNMPYKVGEDGEEVFWPTSAGTIIPNGGFGDVIHLTVHAPTTDADYLARRAVFELRTLSMSRR